MIGIYRITNKNNNKIYIGRSLDISRRWKEHIRDLNKGIHINQALQKDWDTYGEGNFTFDVIRQCDESELKFVELNEIFSSWEELYNVPSIKDELVYLICNYFKNKNKDYEIDFKSANCVDKRPLNFNVFVNSGDERELYFSLRNLDYINSEDDQEKYIKSNKIKMDFIKNRNADLVEIEYGG
jgi:group I intron endonuclease